MPDEPQDTPALIPIITGIVGVIGKVLGFVRDKTKEILVWLLPVVRGLLGDVRTLARAVRVGFDVSVRAFHHVLTDILHGHFLHLVQDYQTLTGKLKAWFNRHFEWLLKWRKLQQQWFDQTMRPVLDLLQRIRQVNTIFRIFGFRFAKELDRTITDLESRIIRNTLALHRQFNTVSNMLSLILDPLQIIRRNPLFIQMARGVDSLFKGLTGHGFVDWLGRGEPGTRTIRQAANFRQITGDMRASTNGTANDFTAIRDQARSAFRAYDAELLGPGQE